MSSILVQMAGAEWTEEALHLACGLASASAQKAAQRELSVVLLYLMPAQHFSWLGTSFGCESFSPDESDHLRVYEIIAASYGVDLRIQPIQCISYMGALVDAVEQLDGEVLFATVPRSRFLRFSWWSKARAWGLRRRIARQGCRLYTLDEPTESLILAVQFGLLEAEAKGSGV